MLKVPKLMHKKSGPSTQLVTCAVALRYCNGIGYPITNISRPYPNERDILLPKKFGSGEAEDQHNSVPFVAPPRSRRTDQRPPRYLGKTTSFGVAQFLVDS
ncbi:hypothetical protein EJ08DRAFT_457607 [Tothia fuscella]|uniref:Uncharacterized protein n=1 Tax=Tothia fuscella TaxID=1048955 RepID=A0A9P4NIL3_9PEZI|nr:hypothetical protein EJ08DRAFT_457607 [Tothia fuscella]